MSEENWLIKIFALLGFGKFLFELVKYIINKPKVDIIKIEKDIHEYLYSINSTIVNSGPKNVHLSKAKIKLFDVKPPRGKDKKVLLSYLKLLRNNKKKPYFEKNLVVKRKSKEGTYLTNLSIESDQEYEKVKILGLTSDTKGMYNCCLQILFSPSFFGLFPIKSNWYNFEYEGEIPPGVVISNVKKNRINKLFQKQLRIIMFDVAKYLSIRISENRIETKTEAEDLCKELGGDILIQPIVDYENCIINYQMFTVNKVYDQMSTVTRIIENNSQKYSRDLHNIKSVFHNQLKVLFLEIAYRKALLDDKYYSSIELLEQLILLSPGEFEYYSHMCFFLFKIRKPERLLSHCKKTHEIFNENKQKAIIYDFEMAAFALLKERGNEFISISQAILCDNIAEYIEKAREIWNIYCEIVPQVTDEEIHIIASKIVSGVSPFEIRKWFIFKRKREKKNIFIRLTNYFESNNPDKIEIISLENATR